MIWAGVPGTVMAACPNAISESIVPGMTRAGASGHDKQKRRPVSIIRAILRKGVLKMTVLKVVNLTKKYNDVPAVDNISFEIREGEIFGLLGPNGAGKSSTINMIVNLVSMDSGDIYVLDRNIKKHRDETRRNIGIVPQDIAIYEDLTSLENVMFFASLYGLSGSELRKRAKEALEFTGLTDNLNKYPREFSGGMKRRLNIACAIAHRPALIIMDEPTVGIDPQSRSHILQSVEMLNRLGCTVIYTSHYMEEVEQICTRIAIMDHGKIIAMGTKDELTSIISDTNSLWVTVLDIPDGIDMGGLRSINGITAVDIDENIIKISSRKDVSNLDKIISWFSSSGLSIKNFESRTPDLETVFLSLTGRKLRD
jgi:ABC-2 type transport system ATP-binding protein